MPRKNSFITVTDQFCGAGGSSQGVRRLANRNRGGLEVKLALNHWKLAIDTHNTNFPDTIHDCTDISACNPRRYPSTDILITSPECTNHSLAKGIKVAQKQMDLFNSGKLDPAAERSRATMWDVCRFAEYHQYNAIIVENVVDARKWVMFDSWLHAMYALGYLHRCVYLNSMHAHPTPQSRDRMYVVFWKKGNKTPMLEYMPSAYCPKCEKDVQAVQTWKSPDKKFGKYRQQYVFCCPAHGAIVEPYFYASFNCIDWSDPGRRIGDRDKPLSPNTLKRIKYGLDRYGASPFQVVNYTPGYCKSVTDATATMRTNDSHGILQPIIVKAEHSRNEQNARGSFSPLQTQTTRQSMAVVVPYIIEMNRSGKAKPADAPFSTFTAGGINHALLVENKGTSMSRPVTDAAGCITTKSYHGLLTTDAVQSFLTSYYNGSHCLQHITEATGTMTTRERIGIVYYKTPAIEDCYYRMLKPAEIKLAMAFDGDYVVLGSGKDQVRQLGNAVTPPAMEWLVQQVIESLK